MIGELAALGAAISWAIAPILYRKALLNTKPISANIVRCATNAAVLVPILLLSGQLAALTSLPMQTIMLVVISGIVGLGIGDTLYMIGLKYVGVSRAVPLGSTYPLFSLIWATLILNQHLTVPEIIGAAVIVGGIWLLTRQKNDDPHETKNKLALIGITVSLAAALVWSISIALMDAAAAHITSLSTNYAIITVRITSLALFLLILAPLLDKEHGFAKMNRNTIIGLCIGGLIANGLGWLLMNISFQNITVANATPISSTSPLFAAIAGFLLFREKMTPKAILGAIAIVTGICLIFIL